MAEVEMLGRIEGPIEGYVTVIVRARAQAGELVPRHTHPGIESIYILEGEETVMVEAGSQTSYVKRAIGFKSPLAWHTAFSLGRTGRLWSGTMSSQRASRFPLRPNVALALAVATSQVCFSLSFTTNQPVCFREEFRAPRGVRKSPRNEPAGRR